MACEKRPPNCSHQRHALLRQLVEVRLQHVEFLLAQRFDINQPVAGPVHGGDQLVELQVNRQRVLVLRPLNQKDHQEGDDGRAGVDHELPRVGEPEDRSGDGPRDDDRRCRGETGGAAGPCGDRLRTAFERPTQSRSGHDRLRSPQVRKPGQVPRGAPTTAPRAYNEALPPMRDAPVPALDRAPA